MSKKIEEEKNTQGTGKRTGKKRNEEKDQGHEKKEGKEKNIMLIFNNHSKYSQSTAESAVVVGAVGKVTIR